MKNRIKQVRKSNNLSMEKFGERIRITRSSVCKIENGENNPSEQTIKLICQEFDINEEWLRTGQGEMTYPKGRNQIVSEFAADLIKEPESFKTRLIESLAKLDEKDWIELEKIFDKLTRD